MPNCETSLIRLTPDRDTLSELTHTLSQITRIVLRDAELFQKAHIKWRNNSHPGHTTPIEKQLRTNQTEILCTIGMGMSQNMDERGEPLSARTRHPSGRKDTPTLRRHA
ncbi:hypothetical protein CEXT_347721 [Caerostris extrusa]|uniref:Uncharacterized protein n=1 Tax=Caerostris extrusa TaxID=172846 RepID=A0AAV4SH49_CAEEX|nr:hypothetical protein CEXT_347721 [Caerostris extrusa]